MKYGTQIYLRKVHYILNTNCDSIIRTNIDFIDGIQLYYEKCDYLQLLRAFNTHF